MYTDIPDLRRFDDAIRNPHRVITKAVHHNLVTGADLTLPVKDGDVTDDADSNVRRSLTCTLPPRQDLWDALDTIGGQITITQTLRYVDGRGDTVPLGRFILDTDDFDYGPDGSLSISGAPDLWGKVQKAGLPAGQRTSVASNTIVQELQRLIAGAWNSATYPFPGWASVDTSVTAKVGPLVYDDGREAPILDMLKAHSLDAYFNRDGLGVIAKIAELNDATTPVALINAGARGVMIGARRSRDRTKVRNAVEVSTSAPDVVFTPQVTSNDDPTEPLSTVGPLGFQVEQYSSPLLRSSTQGRAVGKTRLTKTMAVGRQLTLEAVGNFLLDSGDPIAAALADIDRNTPRPTELHIIGSVSHPLAPAGTQSITTRSTRPDTDST